MKTNDFPSFLQFLGFSIEIACKMKKMKFEMKKNENFPRFFKIFKICKNLGKSSFFSFQTSFFFILQAISIEKPRNSKKT